MDLTEAEDVKKRWQEYTEELYKKDLHDPDNHDGGLTIWNEAGQRLIEFCQENALLIANTLFQQHKRRLYTWTSPDGQH